MGVRGGGGDGGGGGGDDVSQAGAARVGPGEARRRQDGVCGGRLCALVKNSHSL